MERRVGKTWTRSGEGVIEKEKATTAGAHRWVERGFAINLLLQLFEGLSYHCFYSHPRSAKQALALEGTMAEWFGGGNEDFSAQGGDSICIVV